MGASAPPPAPPPAPALYLWRGHALVLGVALGSTLHEHFAAQLSLGLTEPFRLRWAEDQAWQTCESVLFAPHQTHQIDAGVLMAHLFVEPSGQRITIPVSEAGRALAPDQLKAMRACLNDCWRQGYSIADAQTLAADWLNVHINLVEAPMALDPRIEAAIEALNAMQMSTIEEGIAGHLAQRACLSESRFTHLFRAQTGMSVSRYLLWTRLLAAVEQIALAVSLTEAAHAAGFADLAHMSRSFKACFGVAPSALQKMTIAFKRDGF